MVSFPFGWQVCVAGVGILVCASSEAGSYADQVIHYVPGSTAASGYDTPLAALGEPSRSAPAGPSDAVVTPFNPPWTKSQLVSIGEGGSLTVQFSTPILNSAANAFGVDFILFGNNGFSVTDYGVPPEAWTTTGSLFTFDVPGSSKVWVSANNQDYYELVPPSGVSAIVDGLFPTDASGSFTQPVNPVLLATDFSGKDLAGIRAMYAGSAGGAGFDLAWARTSLGAPAQLASAQYVKIEVLSGKVEVDALSAVPEPSVWVLGALGLAGLVSRRHTR